MKLAKCFSCVLLISFVNYADGEGFCCNDGSLEAAQAKAMSSLSNEWTKALRFFCHVRLCRKVCLAFEKIFQSVGRMKVTMVALIVGCVGNIILVI